MRRILVIGADPDARQISKVLGEIGDCEFILGGDGYGALGAFETFQPQIIVMDMGNERVENLEVLRHLKELDVRVEVIVVAGEKDPDATREALQLGASDVISKPLTVDMLKIALKRAQERTWLQTKLEEVLEEVQKRHDFEHKLIMTSMDGIIANDRKGNLIIFNEGASRIYGYTRHEALSSIHVTQLYPEGEARRIKKLIYGPDYGGPGKLINYETQALTKQNELVPILLSASLLFEHGEEVATVGYFKNLGELKALQRESIDAGKLEAVLQVVEDMAERIEPMVRAMKNAVGEAVEQANRYDGLRNSIEWEKITEALGRLSSLLHEMRLYISPKALNLQWAPINELVTTAIETVSPAARQKGLVIETELSADLPSALIDVEKMRTSIVQLLLNAQDALQGEAKERKIWIRTRKAAPAELEIEIEDGGSGVDPSLQQAIFRPFFSTKGPHGTGMGLSLVEKIIKEHHGSIRFRSQPGEGSVFTLVLPISPPEAV